MADRDARRPHGFTLIELLVAISILAIVAVLGWRGLDGITRARTTLTRNLDQTRSMQLAFAQMQSDCAKVIPAALVPQHPPLVADGARLMMVRYVYVEDQPPRLQVVTYRVRDGILRRQESTPTRDLGELAGAWQAAAGDTDADTGLALEADIASMTVRLWEGNGPWRAADAGTAPVVQQQAPATAAAAGGTAGSTVVPAASGIAGVEVALQLRDRSTTLLKVFLVGAV